MPLFLGIDTSNYTTSAALYDSRSGEMLSEKKLLPVKEGEAGLRQSDAVFHHTKQLPEIIGRLFSRAVCRNIAAVGVSYRPRNLEGSYMPCFLCGEGLADSIGAVLGVPVYKTSHQVGHILAALYSAHRLDMISSPFGAFHASGGTTDCLYCTPHETELIRAEETGTSLDLKAGQLIDRAGLMMGLKFPCGAELEKLSDNADSRFKVKAVLKNGSCCLSGYENNVRRMLDSGETRENTARYVLEAVCAAVYEMTVFSRESRGSIPMIYAGGVMSNRYIRSILESRLDEVYFSEPQYSCDNAAGTALYAYYTHERQYK
ncbi:MAG: peptidase M22 [Oscillospiraceae bacterium]|nr:peptidase M22 [Oscillospiraceae bacterium]